MQDPAFAQQVNAALDDLRALGPDVVTTGPVAFPLPASDQQNDPQVAALGPIPSAGRKRRAVHGDPRRRRRSDRELHVEALNQLREKYSNGATTMYMLGQPTSTDDFKKMSEQDLKKGETIGIVVAVVVLLIVFGSAIAGVTPIIMGFFAIGVALGSRRRSSGSSGTSASSCRT